MRWFPSHFESGSLISNTCPAKRGKIHTNLFFICRKNVQDYKCYLEPPWTDSTLILSEKIVQWKCKQKIFSVLMTINSAIWNQAFSSPYSRCCCIHWNNRSCNCEDDDGHWLTSLFATVLLPNCRKSCNPDFVFSFGEIGKLFIRSFLTIICNWI